MSPQRKENWIECGLELLGNEGVSAITIERLTQALGVTKGSFYHHFKNIQAFKEALLDAWETDSTVIIRAIETKGDPFRVLKGLLGEYEKRSPLPEIAIRAWAVTDPLPREYMTRLDALRITFIAKLLGKILGTKKRGEAAALVLYTATVGSLMSHPPLPLGSIKTIYGEFFRLYGIGPAN